MEVFRIVKEEYANTLFASGRSNRWNLQDQKVVYTAASRSLACLENVVHSSGEALQEQFMVMIVYVPDDLSISSVKRNQLPSNWYQRARHSVCQQLGSDWYNNLQEPLLKVPSAIVHQESNYVLNTQHPDYQKIQLVDVQPFAFDPRLKKDQYE